MQDRTEEIPDNLINDLKEHDDRERRQRHEDRSKKEKERQEEEEKKADIETNSR